MCFVSMIYEHYTDEWQKRIPQTPLPNGPFIFPKPITPYEVDQLEKLIKKAQQYNKKHDQPDYELDSKRKTLKDIAKQLGVEIAFL